MDRILALGLLAGTALGCGTLGKAVRCSEVKLTTTGWHLCSLPDWPDRPYQVHLPAAVAGATPLPVVLVLHGGSGNTENVERTSCAGGDLASSTCLSALGDREGFAVVYPSGTASRWLHRSRAWNASGGQGDLQCVSGWACEDGVDEKQYFTDLLDDLQRSFSVDPNRIFATGISNGAAMAYKLACQLGDRVAAIAPIAGGDQYSAGGEVCAPPRAVSILHIHGTDDPCWEYNGGTRACAQRDGKRKTSVDSGIHGGAGQVGWVARNGCAPTAQVEDLADTASDGMTSRRERYLGCRNGAEVSLITVQGGGHTWPGGWQYFPKLMVGASTTDFNANELMWAFFREHPR